MWLNRLAPHYKAERSTVKDAVRSGEHSKERDVL